MNIEKLRAYILSLPYIEERFPFGEDTLTFYVAGKMFALTVLSKNEFVNLKCNPERAIELRERYEGVRVGWHMNKKHWNSVYFSKDVSDHVFFELIRHSYNCVILSLPKRQQTAYELLP